MSDLGRYRKLYTRLWRHPAFRALSEGHRLLTLYLLTGPQTNRAGVYRVVPQMAAEDLRLSTKTVSRGLLELRTGFGWAFDASSRVLEIPSWLDWNPPPNRSVVAAILKDLHEIPPCAARDRAEARLQAWLARCRPPCPAPWPSTGTGTGSGTEGTGTSGGTESVETVEKSAATGRGFEAIGTTAQRLLPFTVADLEEAKRQRAALGTCPHTPPCTTDDRCLQFLAIEQRVRRVWATR